MKFNLNFLKGLWPEKKTKLSNKELLKLILDVSSAGYHDRDKKLRRRGVLQIMQDYPEVAEEFKAQLNNAVKQSNA